MANPDKFETTGQPGHDLAPRAEIDRPLTAQYGTHLFYHAQAFGQGRPELIRNLLTFTKIIRPHWTMPDTLRDEIERRLKPKVDRFFTHTDPQFTANPAHASTDIVLHQAISEPIRVEDTRERLAEMQTIFNTEPLSQPHLVLASIALRTMQQDFKWLYLEGGRPRKGLDPKTPRGDTWLSYLCHYILNGNPTGIAEYDEAYKQTNDGIRRGKFLSQMSWEDDAAYDIVLRLHAEKHPGQEVKW